jgi:excisionase family DNA binding protein
MKAYMSVAQAAEHLNVSQKAIRKWVAERKLDSYHFGRLVRIRLADLEAFAQQGLIPAKES